MPAHADTATLTPQENWYAAHLPLKGQVIADVGANAGRLSEFFWRMGEGSNRVVSIEPLVENIALIKARIPVEAKDRWHIEPCVVSNRAGSVKLHAGVTKGSGWNSVVDAKGARKVRAQTLAALVPTATVVKLDIEGHEHEVLDEALPQLPGVRAWAIELHQRPEFRLQSVLGNLMAHGYRVFAACQHPQDPNAWASEELSGTLDWSAVPAGGMRADGRPIRTLHVLALKPELISPAP
jgi:FkbM family methyltransferase